MKKNIFQEIYIIGNGVAAIKCAEILADNLINFKFLKTGQKESLFFLKRLLAKRIVLEDFTELIQNQIINTKVPTLIFSINNTFIFPTDFLNNNNITIINYHNSLLPLHRGMNAEAWAIFNGDEKSGVTWHLVDDAIDTGPIIYQSAIPIHQNMTSIDLLRMQSAAAIKLFKQNIGAILANNYKLIPNDGRNNKSIHYKRQIPGNSILDCLWPREKIWNFLRAMDYGPYYNLGRPKIMIGADTFSWRSYSYRPDFSENDILVKGDDIILRGCFYLHGAFII